MNNEISPPQNVVAVSGNASLAVTWVAPASNSGSPITDYIVKYSSNGGVAGSWKTALHPVSTATSLTITGLTNGKRYVIKVIAKNAAGISPPSANSAPVIPIIPTLPGVPTSLVVVPGVASLTVTWVAPINTGGLPITDYIAQYSSNSGSTWTTFNDGSSPATSLTITGLTNGTAYVVRVIAGNVLGYAEPSVNSAQVTPSAAPAIPSTAPGRPTSVVATRGNASLAVTWVAPASTGGSAITDYLVKYSSDSGSTWKNFIHPVSTAPSLTVTRLTNGTAYVIKVIARNAIGISLPSVNSSPVTPATVPDAPTLVVAVRRNASLAVTWVAPANNGGSPITDYLVQYSSNSGSTWTNFAHPASTATSLTVTGLTNGTAYVVGVSAVNAVGSSATQSISGSVTPAALPGTPQGLTAINRPRQNPTLYANFGTWDRVIELSWAQNLNPDYGATTSYVIEEGSPPQTLATLERENYAGNYAHVGLVENKEYSYLVYAENSAGRSAEPAKVKLTAAFTEPDAPIAPTEQCDNCEATCETSACASYAYPRAINVSWATSSDNHLRGGTHYSWVIEHYNYATMVWTSLSKNNYLHDLRNEATRSITIPARTIGNAAGTWSFRVRQWSTVGKYWRMGAPSGNSKSMAMNESFFVENT